MSPGGGGDGTGALGGDWTRPEGGVAACHFLSPPCQGCRHFLPLSDRQVVNPAQTQGPRLARSWRLSRRGSRTEGGDPPCPPWLCAAGPVLHT